MFRPLLLCLTLCAALGAQPRLPKRDNAQSGSHLSNTQQANVEKLKYDLLAIKSKSQVTPQMKQQLTADLQALAEGAAKPSQSSVQKLVNDLTAATADKNLSSREIAQLSNDFYKVLNSAGISTSEFNAVVSDVQAILKAAGVSSADAATIASDLKAIGAEVQKGAQAVKDGTAPKKFPRR
ncbi:MAG: hypothetical protein ABIZ80_05315 [Bryobacteraceae bacterium]